MRGETGPDFIEALARGLDVIRAFEPNRPTMTLSEVAVATGLARPTARRMLLTLEELGYVRTTQGAFALTPRVLELGMAYIGSTSIWDIARPHMEQARGTYWQIIIARSTRRIRHSLCCSSSCTQDYHPRGDHWHALSRPSNIAWESATRRADTD